MGLRGGEAMRVARVIREQLKLELGDALWSFLARRAGLVRQRVHSFGLELVAAEDRVAVLAALVVDALPERRVHPCQLRQLGRLVDAAGALGLDVHLLEEAHHR